MIKIIKINDKMCEYHCMHFWSTKNWTNRNFLGIFILPKTQ